MQAISDMSLLAINQSVGEVSIPSRLLGYMAAGRPVIAVVDNDSEVAKILMKSNCGLVCGFGDKRALADSILMLRSNDSLRIKLGVNGRNYLISNFSMEKITNDYFEYFESMVI